MNNSQYRFGILTISNGSPGDEAIDKNAESLLNCITSAFQDGNVVERASVSGEAKEISTALIDWCDKGIVDVILTIGGTGSATGDVTPEATKSVIDREAPGLAIAISAITPKESRAICGLRKRTLIINLPGSPKGALHKIVANQIKQQAVELLKDSHAKIAAAEYRPMNGHTIKHLNGSTTSNVRTTVDAANVASRARKSPFPMIAVEPAQQMILAECATLSDEMATLKTGLGCILAEDVFARDPLPPFPASVKDGYAIRVTDQPMDILTVLGDSTAGENPDKFKMEEGYCVRISTGAPVPDGANTIIQVEDTELIEKSSDGKEETTVKVLKQPQLGQDIRKIGCDIPANEKVLSKGARLGPAELGTLAAVGIHQFKVYKKPKIALLSTGNELISPFDPMEKGRIRDSNKTTLIALFTEAGYDTVDIGIARDTPQEVLEKLIEGMEKADIVVSSGGVSMGERDYLKHVLTLDLKAEVHFGSVLMKPGKPTTFATCEFNGSKKFIFGLPGNPVSATVTSHLFVIPACRKLCGWPNPFYATVKVKLLENLKLTDTVRPEYHRTIINWYASDSDGYPTVKSTGNQVSSRLLSCNGANALVMLPPGSGFIPEGTIIEALLLST